jgi:hypothetical protein
MGRILLISHFMLLQFVEIKDADRQVQLLEGDQHVVGHSGDIVPKLCNGRISKRHATVSRMAEEAIQVYGLQWFVVDGFEGKESTNGLWTVTDGKISEGMLTKPGDRIYLLRDVDACREAYLEVVAEPSTSRPCNDRSTVGFEQKLIALKETVAGNRESIGAVQTQLGATEQKVEFLIDTIERLGRNWKRFVIGGLTASFLAGAGITAIAFYTHLDQVFDRIFPAQSK